MPPSSFTVLQDKSLSSPVVLAAWCPTMDLLATVSLDNQLTIRRLDWQTLWVACPNTAITALCWKPDGKEVVTGHSDGSIRHFSVERCKLCHEAASPKGPHAGAAIAHLSWVEADARMQGTPMLQHLKYRHTRFFGMPPLASDPAPKPPTAADLDFSSPAAIQLSHVSPWPSPPDALHLLISSDSRGTVCISAYGQLQLARLDVRAACGLSGSTTVQLQAHLSSDLSSLVALVQPDQQPQQPQQLGSSPINPGTGQPGASGSARASDGAGVPARSVLQAVAYRTEVLQHPHVQQLAVLAVHLREVVAAACHGVSSAHKEWQTSEQDLRKRLGQLAQSLRDHAEVAPGGLPHAGGQAPSDEWQEDEELVEGEIICLLATGCASPGMHAFLTSTLGEHGLRRLAKTLDSAVQAVHALLLDQVQPATEVALFLLAEIKGLALAGCGSLGLQAEQVSLAELSAAKVALQCEALRMAITSLGCQLRTLFNWLHTTCQNLEGSGKEDTAEQHGPASVTTHTHIQDILDLLTGHLAKDIVTPDLQDAPVFLVPGEEAKQVASLALAKSAHAAEARKLMDLMYRPLVPADLAAAVKAPGNPSVTPSTWPSKPLHAELKALASLCEDVLGAVCTTLSPALLPIVQVPLAACVPGAGPLVCQCHLPQLKSDPRDGLVRVCVAIPPQAGHTGAALNPNPRAPTTDHLLLVELGEALRRCGTVGGAATASAAAAAAQDAATSIQASLVQVPPSVLIEDLGYYREGQLGVLLAPSGVAATADASSREPGLASGGPGGQLAEAAGSSAPVGQDARAEAEAGRSRWVLLPLRQVPLLPVEVQAATARGSLLQSCLDNGHVSTLCVEQLRGRACPIGSFEPPLALSGPRGVAAAFSDCMRAYMFDVEEDDEEGEEGEEGGDGEGEDGDADGMQA